MSHIATLPSTRVPHSAGDRLSGGSYCTVIASRSGSRPFVHHQKNIRINTPMGIKIGQLLRRINRIFSAAAGSWTHPLFQPTTTVRPRGRTRSGGGGTGTELGQE